MVIRGPKDRALLINMGDKWKRVLNDFPEFRDMLFPNNSLT